MELPPANDVEGWLLRKIGTTPSSLNRHQSTNYDAMDNDDYNNTLTNQDNKTTSTSKSGEDDPWNAHLIARLLHKDMVDILSIRFPYMDLGLKQKLLLSLLSIRKTSTLQDMKPLLEKASTDQETWIQVISSILNDFPQDGSVHSSALESQFKAIISQVSPPPHQTLSSPPSSSPPLGTRFTLENSSSDQIKSPVTGKTPGKWELPFDWTPLDTCYLNPSVAAQRSNSSGGNSIPLGTIPVAEVIHNTPTRHFTWSMGTTVLSSSSVSGSSSLQQQSSSASSPASNGAGPSSSNGSASSLGPNSSGLSSGISSGSLRTGLSSNLVTAAYRTPGATAGLGRASSGLGIRRGLTSATRQVKNVNLIMRAKARAEQEEKKRLKEEQARKAAEAAAQAEAAAKAAAEGDGSGDGDAQSVKKDGGDDTAPNAAPDASTASGEAIAAALDAAPDAAVTNADTLPDAADVLASAEAEGAAPAPTAMDLGATEEEQSAGVSMEETATTGTSLDSGAGTSMESLPPASSGVPLADPSVTVNAAGVPMAPIKTLKKTTSSRPEDKNEDKDEDVAPGPSATAARRKSAILDDDDDDDDDGNAAAADDDTAGADEKPEAVSDAAGGPPMAPIQVSADAGGAETKVSPVTVKTEAGVTVKSEGGTAQPKRKLTKREQEHLAVQERVSRMMKVEKDENGVVKINNREFLDSLPVENRELHIQRSFEEIRHKEKLDAAAREREFNKQKRLKLLRAQNPKKYAELIARQAEKERKMREAEKKKAEAEERKAQREAAKEAEKAKLAAKRAERQSLGSSKGLRKRTGGTDASDAPSKKRQRTRVSKAGGEGSSRSAKPSSTGDKKGKGKAKAAPKAKKQKRRRLFDESDSESDRYTSDEFSDFEDSQSDESPPPSEPDMAEIQGTEEHLLSDLSDSSDDDADFDGTLAPKTAPIKKFPRGDGIVEDDADEPSPMDEN